MRTAWIEQRIDGYCVCVLTIFESCGWTDNFWRLSAVFRPWILN